MSPVLFVSIFAYAWGKGGGILARELDQGEDSAVPAFRTLHRLRKIRETALCLETSTLIARARCRAAGAFLHTGLPLWLTIDEDVEADDAALRALLACSSVDHLAFAAMRLRGDDGRLNVEAAADKLQSAADILHGPRDESMFSVSRAGAALGVFGRDAIVRMTMPSMGVETFVEDVPPLNYVECPALFLERIKDGQWQGEDVSFCDRARASNVSMLALAHRGVTHAGLKNSDVLR